MILGRFWEVLEGPKIEQNLKKVAFRARSDHDWSWDTILIAILNGFCRFKMDFGRLRWYFVEDFWMISNDCKRFRLQSLMIRATRGRSRRPNHMPSLIGRPKATVPVDLRRLPGGAHSVAKQASSKTLFFLRPRSILE